jgi:hypothetical protein
MFIAHLLARAIRVEADLVDQLFNSNAVLPDEPPYRDLGMLAARGMWIRTADSRM